MDSASSEGNATREAGHIAHAHITHTTATFTGPSSGHVRTSTFDSDDSDLSSSKPVLLMGSSGFGGGLASSPNVPVPGTSINPQTGQPHSAGLTREELAAFKNKGADLLDPTPQTEAVKASPDAVHAEVGVLGEEQVFGETDDGKELSELGGREQAARQLAGTFQPPSPGAITPGKEMPGAWGPVEPVPVPGSDPAAPSSVYQDVAGGLQRVGTAAYSVIPAGLKNALSNHPTEASNHPTGANVTTAPRSTTATTSPLDSAATMLDQAKVQTQHIVQEVQQEASRLVSSTTASGEGVVQQVKGFVGDHLPGAAEPQGLSDIPDHTLTPDQKRSEATFSLRETDGLAPGDKNSGVGALPGEGDNTGVAVLPNEKAVGGSTGDSMTGPKATGGSMTDSSATGGSTTDSNPTKEAPFVSPGSASSTSFAPSSTVFYSTEASENSSSTPKASAPPVADGPSASTEPTTTEFAPSPTVFSSTSTSEAGTAAPVSRSAPSPADVPTKQTPASPPVPKSSGHTDSSSLVASAPPSGAVNEYESSSLGAGALRGAHNDHGGLAAPLPSTFLGRGADHGATDVKDVLGVDADSERVVPDESRSASVPQTNAPKTHTSNTASSFAPLAGVPESSRVDTTSTTPHSNAQETRHSNDRTTSLASVTAIRGGHEGVRSSPLASQSITESENKSSGSFTKLTSHTPGNEHEGVGHPATHGTHGASREVGSYPRSEATHATVPTTTSGIKANDQQRADSEIGATTKSIGAMAVSDSAVDSTSTSSTPVTPVPSQTVAASPARAEPKTIGHGHGQDHLATGHHRTSSDASAEGKKKGGFMSKLKEKLRHNE